MSHAAIPEPERIKRGISASLLRLSAGIEAVDDLLNDFRQALAACENIRPDKEGIQ